MAVYNGSDIDFYSDNIAPSLSNWSVSGGSGGSSVTLNAGGSMSVNIDDVIGACSYLYYKFDTDLTPSEKNNYNNLLFIENKKRYITYGEDNEESIYLKENTYVNYTETKNCVVPTKGRDFRMSLKVTNKTDKTIKINGITIQRSRDISEKQFTEGYDDMVTKQGVYIELYEGNPPIGESDAGRIWLDTTMLSNE